MPAQVIETRPKHVGLVYQCDSCRAPIFLRFATKSFHARIASSCIENFVELERPKERFAFSYLPRHTEVLFREALVVLLGEQQLQRVCVDVPALRACSAYDALGEGGKLRAFEEVMIAQDIAGDRR